ELNSTLVPCANLIYATDRKPHDPNYSNSADNEIHWGQAKVFLQPAYRRNKNPDSNWLEFANPQGLKVPGVSIIAGSQETTNETLKDKKSDKTFVFIHGFGTSFENG